MASEVNVLALVKGSEQYLFIFDDKNKVETLRMLGRYAADPDLSFSWYDAAVMSQKIREALPAPSHATNVQSAPLKPSKTGNVRFQLPLPEQKHLPRD